MLDLGATTFWEDFDLEEAANAAPIDAIVPEGKLDYHHDTGNYCYIGLRRSLCHGWASGPTAWLSEHVLGIKVVITSYSIHYTKLYEFHRNRSSRRGESSFRPIEIAQVRFQLDLCATGLQHFYSKHMLTQPSRRP